MAITIPALNLTGQLPIRTFSASVQTSGSFLSDGLGNQMDSASITASYAVTTSLANRIRSGSVASPNTGSIFFSGSFLYIYTGTQWKSASIS